MENEELKRKLIGLWERTTHLTKEKIINFLDYYFDSSVIEFDEEEGKIVSALIGLPFSFGFTEEKLKGLYIIPLTTEEGYRKKGLLDELLKKFNAMVRETFDFTFLIPHTELMADYYGRQGYYNSFYILEERFTPLHNFKNDYLLSIADCNDKIRLLKEKLIEEIKVKELLIAEEDKRREVIGFIVNIEKKGNSAVIMNHNSNDLEYLLTDDSLRELRAFYSIDSDSKVTGVAFTEKEDLMRLKVVAAYTSDPCSYYSLLDFIKTNYPEHSISVVTSDPKYQIHSIIQLNYASSNPNGGDLDNTFSSIDMPFNLNKLFQPLGMVNILRVEPVLKYLASTRSDINFKLHLRDYSSDSIFCVNGGKFSVGKYVKENNRNILELSSKELYELLLRKNDYSNLIMEAFGIPRLNLQMRLLPV